MSPPSPARRVRGRFISFGLWTSALAFVIVEGYVLQDQLAIGHASTMFMFGSACLVAAVCIGLFAIIMAIGWLSPPHSAMSLPRINLTTFTMLRRLPALTSVPRLASR